MLANDGVALKSAVVQKVALSAKEAPLGVASLARSYVQTIAPLCSGGDLGQEGSSLQSCVDILKSSSTTLLQQPFQSSVSSGIIGVSTGAIVSMLSNFSNSSTNNLRNVRIQEMLNLTSAAVFHAVKQALLGDAPLSFTTPFSSHIASRSTFAAFESKIPAAPGMASYFLPANFSRTLLGPNSAVSTDPVSVIAESYSSVARWSGANLSFVSGIHGLSIYNDGGPILVQNIPQSSAIKIVIPLDSNSSSRHVAKDASSASFKCYYWDIVLLMWKTDGCTIAAVNSSHATVMTTHLTQFGVIFDPPVSTSAASAPSTAPSTTISPSTSANPSTASPTASPSTSAPSEPPNPNLAELSPTFFRASLSLNVSVHTPFSNFFSNSTCGIIFNGTRVSSPAYYVSPNQVICLVAASAIGRIINISVTGVITVSRPFVQFGEIKFSSVEWDNSLSVVSILSSSSLPSAPSLICSQIFSPSSLSLLGLSPACAINGSSITVTLGQNPALMFHALQLIPSIRLFTVAGVPSEIFSTTLPNASIPGSVSNPSVSVQGSTSLGSCSPLSLQLLIPSPSRLARSLQFAPTVSWKFLSAISQNASAVRSVLTNRLANVSSAGFVFLYDSWGAHGFPGSLPHGTYTVAYTVTAWYQRQVSSNITFTVAPQDLPVIVSIQVPAVIRRSSVTEISAVIDVSACSANVALAYVWRIRNAAGQLVFASFEKRLIVPRYTLALENVHTVTLALNGVVNSSSVFVVTPLLPIAVISGGDSIRIGSSGGRISAAQSYDPNFAADKQPTLVFAWSCQGIDLSLSVTPESTLSIPSGLTVPVLCSVTVTSGSTSLPAKVTITPVAGSPPTLNIKASALHVSASQSLVLSVTITSGSAMQYSFQWTSSSKSLSESDAVTTLQSAHLALKPGFLSASQPSVQFKCVVTHISTGVYADAAITVTFNAAPDCSGVAPSVSSESCVGAVSSTCSVTAMRTKLRVSLSDEIGAVAGCVDDNSPINYRLLAFRSACSASATRQLLATSSSPSFSGITLASGVKALGFEAVDAFGAVSLVCSPQFTVSDASVADISSLISSSSFIASLAGDAQGQQRFAANLAASLSSLYASNADASALSTIKESAFAFLNSSSSVIVDSTAAAQTAATLFSLVTLPGSISPASSASALIMFQHIASSSLAMLSSGAASRDLAVEISSALVQGSALLLKGVSASSGRRLLGYKSGMESAMSAIVSAAKVQVHALGSGQIAVVEDQFLYEPLQSEPLFVSLA